MTTLEQLVPPCELCQQIPKDAFNDTALVWFRDVLPDGVFRLVDGYMTTRAFALSRPFEFYPAPTAQEILEAMPDYHLWKDVGHAFRFFTRGGNGTAGIVSKPSRFPEMLLSVWLTVRRMEEQEKADAKEESK